MNVAGSPHASMVENVTAASAVMGWSTPSVSATSGWWTVSVQVSLDCRSVAGSSVNVVGPPLTVSACAPLRPHDKVNAVGATVTGSLKVTERLAASATPAAPAAGPVLATGG